MRHFFFFCLLTLLAATSAHSETFRNPRRIPTSDNPVGVRVADINGDGLPDIIYGDAFVFPNVIHILLAQPGGNYTAVPPVTLPSQTVAVCQPVDANGDHKLDLVCPYYPPTGPSGEYLETFFGNGDGTFQSPIVSTVRTIFNVYDSVYIYPPADLNSDGHADLIVSTEGSPAIMLGDGAGHFTYSGDASGGNGPVDNFAITDVNGDGKLDLLSGRFFTVAFGNGNGAFSSPTYYSTYNNCVFHDMDGDGHIDAICAGNPPGISGTQLAILHGNSNGTFTPVATQSYAGTAIFSNPIAVADLNNDGIQDILAYSDDGLAVMLGKPNLQFAAPVHYPVGYIFPETRRPTVVADLNNDGSPDFVASGPDGVFITYGHPDGTFDTGSVVESGNKVTYATVADFNGDRIPDVATTGDSALKLRLGNGDGTFGPVSSLPSGTADFGSVSSVYEINPIYHGDFNGDGKQDILAFGSYPSSSNTSPAPPTNPRAAFLLFGHGDGTFDDPLLVPGSTSLPDSVSTLYKHANNLTVVDLNKDGRDDIITADTGVIYSFLATGVFSFNLVTFTAPTDVTYTRPNTAIAVADFNHDGKLDAVVGGINNAYIFLGQGDGTFAPSSATLSIPQSNGSITSSIATGDFDGDGNPDIALVNYRNAYVYYGNGDGTFSAVVIAGVYNEGYTSIAAADLNHDGLDDLVLNGTSMGPNFDGIGVIHAKFGRTFDLLTTYTAGNHIASRDVADLNRDGFPDLIFANGDFQITANAYTVLLNNPNPTVIGTLTANPEPSLVNQPFTLTAALSAPDGSNTSLSGPITFAIDGATVGTATLANNTASISVSAAPAIGVHQVTATWPGDNTYSGIALRATHTVTGYPVILTLTVNPNPAAVASPVTYSAGVDAANASDPAPTGNITVTDNGTTIVFGVGPIAQLHSTGTRGFAPGGNHVLTLNYTGDALHSPASTSTTFFLTPVPSNITLQGSPNPANYNQPVTFTASISDILSAGWHDILGSGTVTFTGLPGGPVVISVPSTVVGITNTVTYTTNTLMPGSYPVAASFSGNPSLNPSTSSPITQVVNSTATRTTLAANPATVYQHQTVVLSAHVTGALATPTGTIQFLDGTTPLFTITLASGSAAFATALLSVGAHTITAVYSGDTNNLTSTSSAVTVTIQPSDFTLTLDPPTISLVTGHHTTLHLTATSVGNFADTLHLTATNLPQWVTLNFTPTDLQLATGGKATTSVYVDTDAVIGYLSHNQPANPRPSYGSGAAAAALALILTPVALRRRKRLAALLSLTIAAALLASSTGCSGKYPDSTPPGTYNLQITATGAHGLTHTITLPLIVTN